MGKAKFFFWLGLGIAVVTGGVSGVIFYLLVALAFRFAETAYDAIVAFSRGFASGKAERNAEKVPERPKLRVINGGRR